MSDTYAKSDLVKEVATAAHISKRRTELVLETLAQIAYREARRGFAVPGICRMEVVRRQARKARNPKTGQILMIAAHDALRIKPVKRAKDAVTPTPAGLVQILAADEVMPASDPTLFATAEAPTATPISADAKAVSAPADTAPTKEAVSSLKGTSAKIPYSAVTTPATPPAVSPAAPSASQVEEEALLSFLCTECHQEIEAPLSMAGTSSECPTCGASLTVPFDSEPNTLWYRPPEQSATKPTLDENYIAQMKGRTIRIDLSDDF